MPYLSFKTFSVQECEIFHKVCLMGHTMQLSTVYFIFDPLQQHKIGIYDYAILPIN